MSSASLSYTISNNTPADATEVQQNFVDLRDFVNDEVVHVDGSNAMSAPLLLSGNPSAAAHAVRKAYTDGPYVLAKNSNMVCGTDFIHNDQNYYVVKNFQSEERDSHGAFVPASGVFTAPTAGLYHVGFVTELNVDDPSDQLISKALYRFRVAVRNSGGTVQRSVDALRVCPYVLNRAWPFGAAQEGWYGVHPNDEPLKLASSQVVYCEAGNNIVVQCSTGGAVAAANTYEYPMLDSLTIAWLHGLGS